MTTISSTITSPRIEPNVPLVPWWRVGVMWLFVGGLGVVVAGSFALLATALEHADVVLPQAALRTALPSAPALQARNHAATPKP